MNPTAFAQRYPGVAVFGRYDGSLANARTPCASRWRQSHHRLRGLPDADGRPTRTAPDGPLKSSIPVATPMIRPTGRASAQPGGSPGAANLCRPCHRCVSMVIAATLRRPLHPAPAPLTGANSTTPVQPTPTCWILGDGRANRGLRFPMILPRASIPDRLLRRRFPVGGSAHRLRPDRQGDQLFLHDAAGQRVDALLSGLPG